MPRARYLLPGLILALVATVCLLRAAGLARDGWRPTAADERRWLEFARGVPELEGRIEAAAAAVPRGTSVVLRCPESAATASWLRHRWHYHAPGRPAQAVVRGDAERLELGAGPGTVVVHLDRRDPWPAAGPERELRAAGPLRLVAGLGLALLLGAVALRIAAGLSHAAALILALPLGFVGVALIAALLVVVPAPAATIGLAAAALLVLAGLLWTRGSERSARPSPALSVGIADLVLALALGVFLWRLGLAPLWSWDHYACWGTKARWIADGAGVDPSFLRSEAFGESNPHYPLGVPLGWLALALGSVPGTLAFKLWQGAAGVALALLVRSGALAAGAGPIQASALAAWLAASPLYWDTVHLGLADLVLALIATAAAVILIAAAAGRAALWPAGVLVGFLPWIKPEGWALASWLLVLGAVAQVGQPKHRNRLLGLTAPALALAFGALAARAAWLGEGLGFLAGDAAARLAGRLAELPALLLLLVRELARPDWLGIWLALPAALVAVLVARRRRTPAQRPAELASWLGAAMLLQLLLYLGIYSGTYLDPELHVYTSFARIAAALLPLLLLALAGASASVAPPGPSSGAPPPASS